VTKYDIRLLRQGWRRGKFPGAGTVPPTPDVVIEAADRWAERDAVTLAERVATDTDRMQALRADGSVTP
jgi:hypothetical protein